MKIIKIIPEIKNNGLQVNVVVADSLHTYCLPDRSVAALLPKDILKPPEVLTQDYLETILPILKRVCLGREVNIINCLAEFPLW